MTLTAQQVIDVFCEITDRRGISDDELDPNTLRQLLAKPFATRSGLPAYPTLLNKVAVLMQGFIFDKPFSSDNDAVALRCAEIVLKKHGYILQFEDSDADRLIKGIEMGFTTWQRITVWLKRNTVRAR